MDWAFLAISGFLLGSLMYTGWYTTRYEPQAKIPYAVIGAGVTLVVVVNTWLDFIRNQSTWFRVATIIGYAFVAAGLTLLVRERRYRNGKGSS
jgi:hypothetical protein